MNGLTLKLEDFCTWLCEKELHMVGLPCAWFGDPLSVWISSLTGHVYGIDSTVYGWALSDVCCWRRLPRWAQLFVLWTEKYAHCPLTGREAMGILADIEQQYGRGLWCDG